MPRRWNGFGKGDQVRWAKYVDGGRPVLWQPTNTGECGEPPKRAAKDPETEADFLLSRSPITYVDQIKTPLFVIQGAQDPRVVQGESDQIVERLKARGLPVRYDVYEDEGHGFTKRANELRALRDAAEFLESHLLQAE